MWLILAKIPICWLVDVRGISCSCLFGGSLGIVIACMVKWIYSVNTEIFLEKCNNLYLLLLLFLYF